MAKDVSKSKFLLCFKPVVVDHMDDLGLESKGAVETHSMVTLETPMTVRSQKRKFSRWVKAVMFEIVLAKRARDQKGSPPESRCVLSTVNSSVSKEGDASTNRVVNKSLLIKSNSGLPSSSSSPSISTSEPKIDVPKSLSHSKNGINSSYSVSLNHGICLLLMSLTLTIFCGKLCAILFTSIWLYLLPRLTRDGFSPECATQSLHITRKGHNGRNHHNRAISGN